MFKSKIQGFIAGILVAAMLISTLALANPQIREVIFGVNVVVDGETVNFDYDSQPFIMDGRTFLPVRAIADALGVAVDWDDTTQTVYLGEIPERVEQTAQTEQSAAHEIIRFGDRDWLVLDVQDGRALILSALLLDRRAYHGHNVPTTWETSDLRGWLNNEFYNSRFTDDERARIVETTVINGYNRFGRPGGNDTVDKIFLLSLDEVARYFGDSGDLIYSNELWVNDQYNDARLARFINEQGGRWWLRSAGHVPQFVSLVTENGGVTSNLVSNWHFGVRPAMWIYL